MRVRYEFVNGEFEEIEVDDSLGALLVDCDRQEYNNNNKETRRHVSLEGMDYEGALFASPADPAAEVLKREELARLLRAMEALSPDQRELIRRIYFENQRIVDIAREQGVTKQSIHERISRALNKIKKFLE